MEDKSAATLDSFVVFVDRLCFLSSRGVDLSFGYVLALTLPLYTRARPAGRHDPGVREDRLPEA